MLKKNSNWQSIDKLELFVDIIKKMHCDTQTKINTLNKAQDHDIFDVELSSMMHAMHRQSQLYYNLVRQFNIWKTETKDLSKLNLIKFALNLNEEVNQLTKKCQKLTNQWIFKTHEAEKEFYILFPQNLDRNCIYDKHKLQRRYNITNAEILRYKQIRESIPKLARNC